MLKYFNLDSISYSDFAFVAHPEIIRADPVHWPSNSFVFVCEDQS